MSYKPSSGSSDPDVPPGKGLRGPDKQQDEERVQRTRDTDGPPAPPAPAADEEVPGRQHPTARPGTSRSASPPLCINRTLPPTSTRNTALRTAIFNMPQKAAAASIVPVTAVMRDNREPANTGTIGNREALATRRWSHE